MKVEAFSNINVGEMGWKSTRRECEIEVLPFEMVRAHGILTHSKISVVKLMRRGMWLYNDMDPMPHWNPAKGLKFGIVLSYEKTEIERQREEMAAALRDQMASKIRQAGKSAALGAMYAQSTLAIMKSIANGLGVGFDKVLSDDKFIISDGDTISTYLEPEPEPKEERTLLDYRREPWRKR